MITKFRTLAILTLLATSATLPAQVPDSTKTDSAQTLTTITITGKEARARYDAGRNTSATKLPALLRDVPQSVTSITTALVKDQRMKSIADITRYVPGVGIAQGEGNRDQPVIRGNSSTADFFVDGVRDDAQYLRDTYNLERLEALKGSNAMAFGRGGGGGVLNRVTKEAAGITSREVSAEAGSFGALRITTDMQQKLSPLASARLNSVYESSETFREGVGIVRTGLNPTFAASTASHSTMLTAGYEYFYDARTADRGVPSFQGKPIVTDPRTFFGSSENSRARMQLHSGNATIMHSGSFGRIRNRTAVTTYNKFYQNIYPSGATATEATLSAYNHDIDRTNWFNQIDLIISRFTGSLLHDLVAGVELGRQKTSTFRKTGFFGDATTIKVPLADPAYLSPVIFRQSATDADNDGKVGTRSFYLLDQISLTQQLRLIAGARYESFALRYNDHRTGTVKRRTDGMISPRAGIVFKPTEHSSLYANYSVSFLPGSGDQFGSLTDVTRLLEPERFTNYEIGAKWDAFDRLAFAAAAYRLDRTNTRATDPDDPTRIVQTGQQRSRGIELSAMGSVVDRWEIAAGLARQSASIVKATAASPAGATVPLVPALQASLWNKVTLSKKLSVGAGVVHQSKVYAAIDNKVVLPEFARFDGALYATVARGVAAQLNVENVFNRRYFATANGNNNIAPGSPRAATLSLTANF
jgi:catecholate siderophore receptor